jgi:hypothetical protein
MCRVEEVYLSCNGRALIERYHISIRSVWIQLIVEEPPSQLWQSWLIHMICKTFKVVRDITYLDCNQFIIKIKLKSYKPEVFANVTSESDLGPSIAPTSCSSSHTVGIEGRSEQALSGGSPSKCAGSPGPSSIPQEVKST